MPQGRPLLEPSREEKYETALLEAARDIQDTEQVRQEIDGLKRRIEEQAAAERTVADIQAVLNNGKPEEASRLALAALQQYGGADSAAQLIQLKLQADALVPAEPSGTLGATGSGFSKLCGRESCG